MSLIQYVSRIQFDRGAIALLKEEVSALGITRPLLITDPGLERAGILARVLEVLRPDKPVIFAATPENPTEAALGVCLKIWSAEECDGIIGLGGGSPLDLAKAVALIASHGGKFADYDVKTGGSARIGKVVPHVAIPTAAGTGAEVGRASVMTLASGRKCVAVNLDMVANTVICDPELTYSLPSGMTAATGIDAVSHCVETYLSPSVNPPADAIALDGLRRAARWLPIAVRNGSDSEARWQMMMAALQGGMVLQKGLGAAHAMASPLGELELHHGTLVGVLLPHVLRFNAPAVPEKMADLSRAAGKGRPFSEWLADFTRELDLPQTLGAMGVTGKQLAGVPEKAVADHLTLTNPRMCNAEDYEKILKSAL